MTCPCTHRAICHRYDTAARANTGECLVDGCGCAGESGGNPCVVRANQPPTWENETSPQGAQTPAGSDHLPELAERG